MSGSPPKKYLGQNFLTDRNIVDKIIRTADVGQGDNVFEIGPGRGAMTELLVSRASSYVAVEFDHALAQELAERYADNPHVTIIDGDILRIDLPKTLDNARKWKLVANLPYNISSAVLFKVLENRNLFTRMTLMLQKEVAERLVAGPGTRNYGVTSLLLGLHYDMRIEFIVPPTCFFPRPKVDSAVISFTPLESPRSDVGDEKTFSRIVKGAFGLRRKTLFNSLKGVATEVVDTRELLRITGIDGARRGETLSMEEFATLSRTWLMASNKKTA